MARAVSSELQPFFLPSTAGRRFAVLHRPPAGAACTGTVLHLHAFGEEMNKARRMVALQARSLAAAGWAVLVLDLAGCGDSDGDLSTSSWEQWLEDAELAAEWLRREQAGPLWLWGLRAGALLAVQATRRIDDVQGVLLWQPPASGKALLQQFLRLRLAAEMAAGQVRSTVEGLLADLRAGRALEIAGYPLPPALALGLATASMDKPPAACRSVLLEVSTRPDGTLLPGTQAWLESWRASGAEIRSSVVAGPSFWSSQEIEEAPALLDATLAHLALEAAHA